MRSREMLSEMSHGRANGRRHIIVWCLIIFEEDVLGITKKYTLLSTRWWKDVAVYIRTVPALI